MVTWLEKPVYNSPFSTLDECIALDRLVLNEFMPLGAAPKGVTHTVLLYKSPLANEFCVKKDTPFIYTNYCTEYPLTSKAGNVLGSLFVTDNSKTHVSKYNLYVGDMNTEDYITNFPVQSTVNSVYAFWSDVGVTLISPYVNDPFIVQDDKD